MDPLLEPEVYRDSSGAQNIQKDESFDLKKLFERSGAIVPTLYTKWLKNRLSAALGLNDDKMIVLVYPQLVLG